MATTVTLEPSSAILHALTDTVRVVPTVLDQNGQVMTGAPVSFTSTDASVATVDDRGLVKSVGDGSVVVTALSGATVGNSIVLVEQRVATVRVSPDTAALAAVGDTLRLRAEALDSRQQAVKGEHAFEWSSDELAVTVDATGLVTAASNGSAVVTATLGAVSGRAAVTVEQSVTEVRVLPSLVTLFAVGDTVELEARALDANGETVADVEFEWSGDGAAVRVDSSGRVIAVREGNGVATATYRGTIAGSAAVTVNPLAGADRDRAILETLYDATGGPSWIDNANWLTEAPLEDWYGVGTDAQGRVVEISLVANNLTGYIPPELGRLEELRELRLDATSVYVTWCYRPFTPPEADARNSGVGAGFESAGRAEGPYSLSWAMHAAEGRTHGVEFGAGGVRASRAVAAGARRDGRRLAGRIPPELGDLTNLETLSLDLNALSGPIPPELGGLANLRTLSLARNRLTGSLPPELGDLTRLERLNLAVSYDVSLTPPTPRHVLSGPIPPELGKLVNLEELNLKGHKFTGSLPPGFASLAELRYLALTCNALVGPIPPALRRLRGLRHLDLFGNQLEGWVPEWLGQLSDLEHLDFGSNHRLIGPIPPRIGRLTRLIRLGFGSNRLSGPIPAAFGNLTNLESLGLGDNRLAGALPARFGELTNLRSLSVFRNPDLAGSLPRELMQAPLNNFDWRGTGLCAPRDRAFQSWLADIPSHRGERDCTLPPPEVLAAFFEATGGVAWTDNANWLTDEPVSSWFGVTVEDSLLVGLELPGNGLAGTLPPAIGDFVDLKRLDLEGNELSGELPADLENLTRLEDLDLSDNAFSGPVPRGISGIEPLKRLDLSGNGMRGALPGGFANLASLSDFDWSESGTCAPEVEWFQKWLASVATRSGPICEGPFSLSVADAHLSQATQGVGGDVPLIARRPAMVRVLATADRANGYRPNARVAFLLDGREMHAVEMTLGSSRGVAEHSPGQPDQWYRAVVPDGVLVPGVEMAVRIDPDSVVPRTAMDEVRLSLDVRELPPLELTIVPVVTGSMKDADVRGWVQDSGDSPVEFMRTVLPVGELELTLRDPLVVAAEPSAERGTEWLAIVEDIQLIRKSEGGRGYWYGVVNREGDEGIRGIALVEGRVSLGVPHAEVFAHELGHSMSLMHAPCGNPWQVDPDFPYRDGSIGVLGYDHRSGGLVDPSTPDLMSYCHPQWISDYNFRKALEYRIREETRPHALAAAQEAPRGSRLLLWGRVSSEGELHLDPAFVLEAPAALPRKPGPYRIEGVDGDGASVFALDFEMQTASEGGGSFVFLVPFAEDRLGSLDRVVLSGPEGSAALDRHAPTQPMVIAIDRETGRIRSILRGEAAAAAIVGVAADASSGTGSRERVLVSTGLPGPVP